MHAAPVSHNILSGLLLCLCALCLSVCFPQAHATSSLDGIKPGNLLIFYGIPSLINGCDTDISCAVAELSRYDVIVLGDGLQLESNTFLNDTKALLADPELNAGTVVFGYVDLGVITQNLSMEQIKSRVDEWVGVGAKGIFYDDVGYDFETSRSRQNEAVAYVHSAHSLPVIANGFRPKDVLGDDVDATYNPSGVPTELGQGDFYLYESYQVILDEFVDEATWRSKADLLNKYRSELGIGIMSVTTTELACSGSPCPYDQEQFFYAWWSALLDGHYATAWGEVSFGSALSLSEFRERPMEDPGSKFLFSTMLNDSSIWKRETNLGTVFVDTTHQTNDHYGIKTNRFLYYCHEGFFFRRVFPRLRARRHIFWSNNCQTDRSLFETCTCSY